MHAKGMYEREKVVSIVVLLLSNSASAAIYRWTPGSGVTIATDITTDWGPCGTNPATNRTALLTDSASSGCGNDSITSGIPDPIGETYPLVEMHRWKLWRSFKSGRRYCKYNKAEFTIYPWSGRCNQPVKSSNQPVIFVCTTCHTANAGQYRAPNLTGTDHRFINCATSNCHGADTYGTPGQLDNRTDHNFDVTKPSVSSLPRTDAVYLNGAASVSVSRGTIVTVTSRVNDSYSDPSADKASRVGGAEYYIGTIDTSGLSAGTYTVYVRGMDIGKRWSSVQSATLTVLPAKGYINGTVTRSGLPIAGATVSTMGASTTTDVNGNYSLMIESGTYDVTVIKRPEYYDNTTTRISVTPDNTTIQHFLITLKQTGNITGTVTDATA